MNSACPVPETTTQRAPGIVSAISFCQSRACETLEVVLAGAKASHHRELLETFIALPVRFAFLRSFAVYPFAKSFLFICDGVKESRIFIELVKECSVRFQNCGE
jgi:hypothetical protein